MSTSHTRASSPESETAQGRGPETDTATHQPAAMLIGGPTTQPAPIPLVHGPGGATRRAAGALVATIGVVAAIDAFFALTGRVAAEGVRPLILSGVAFVVIALWTGVTRSDHGPLHAMRAPLLAGVIMVAVLALVWAMGLRVPALRGLVEAIFLTSLALAAVRAALATLYRPRTVVISSTDGLLSPASKGAEAVVGVVDADAASPQELVTAAIEAVDQVHADVVRVDTDMSDEMLAHLSWGLRSRSIPLQMDLLQGAVSSSRVRPASTDGASVLVAPPTPPLGQRIAKRSMDILGSLLLIVLLSPLLIGTALAIKLNDRGPIIFRQIRVGKDGESFGIYKFRTMAVDADARLQELLRQQNTEGKPLFKVQNDPRLTRIGGFLRRYSIDELPQLFNVLFGTMSLVGPRPQRDAEVALYTGTASHRLGVSPGMTGLWQVSGRSNLSWEEARRLDVHYAHNWSVGLDISILLRTVKAVVGKDGAY